MYGSDVDAVMLQFTFNGHELLELFARRELSTEGLEAIVEEQSKLIEATDARITRIESMLKL